MAGRTRTGRQIEPWLRDFYSAPPYQPTYPFHRGHKRFFASLFPRHGNYCGPNYSAGRDYGDDLPWTTEPVSWVDYGCAIHDAGYDSLENEDLLRADERLLRYLLRRPYDAPAPAPSVKDGGLVFFALPANPAGIAPALRGFVRTARSVDLHAELYRAMAIAGLACVMIPYRRARSALDSIRAGKGPRGAAVPTVVRGAFVQGPAAARRPRSFQRL